MPSISEVPEVSSLNSAAKLLQFIINIKINIIFFILVTIFNKSYSNININNFYVSNNFKAILEVKKLIRLKLKYLIL
jgi:hypothetical protein